MDTQDKFVPHSRASDDTLDRDTAVSGGAQLDDQDALDAGVNPDADFDPAGLAPVHGPELKAGADRLETRFKRWQLWGAIAGGVALAAGVAGALYLRQQSQSPKARVKAQADKVRGRIDHMSMPKIDLGQANPRRLSHIAARKIEALPVRQVQKRVAHRVAHLFD